MTTPPAPIYTRPIFRLLFAATVGLASLALAGHLATEPTLANHDVAWTLFAGAELLDGAEHSVDIIDTNPPLIYWLTMVVNAAARALGVSALLLYYLGVALLALASTLACWHLLSPVVESSSTRYSLALFILCSLIVTPGYGFGQREHIIIALFLPYALSAGLARSEVPSRRLRATIGMGLAIAIAIKPHFLLAWFAIELFVTMRKRSLVSWSRLENWVMAVSGAVYLGAVLLGAPEYFGLVTEIAQLYSAYDKPIPWWSPQIAVFLAAFLLAVVVRPKSSLGAIAGTLLAFSAASFLVLLAQRKGYAYHYLPILVAGTVAALLVVVSLLEKTPRRSRRLFLGLTYLTSIVALAGGFAFVTERPERTNFVRAINEFADGEPVFVFSSSIDPVFPAVNFTDSRSASPYSCLWIIGGHYPDLAPGEAFPYRSLAEMAPNERHPLTAMVDGLVESPPKVLIFHDGPHKQGFGGSAFDFRRYFAADPRFAGFLSNYEPVAVTSPYTVYQRQTS